MRDLRFAIADWDPDGELYAKRFRSLPLVEQLDRMIVGLGTMSYGELGAERMQVALITSDQEEEQSCFSDTTHLAILHNAIGIEEFYSGTGGVSDEARRTGPSLSQLVVRHAPELDERLREEFAATRAAADAIVAAAQRGEPFDVQISADNDAGRERVARMIDCLRAQTTTLEAIRVRVEQLAGR